MDLTLVITNNCETCKRAVNQLKQITEKKKDINFVIVNINDFKRKGIVIVPALLINDELFSYGDIDEAKLFAKLK